MKTVENLETGEVLLTSAKKVSGGKIQLEFAEIIHINGERQYESAASILNADDSRFNKMKPRRGWVAGTPAMIKECLGIELGENEDSKELNILNPTHLKSGKRFRLCYRETTNGTEYQIENLETSAKRAGKDGDYIKTEAGEYIFGNVSVVVGEPKHLVLPFAKASVSTPAEVAVNSESIS